MYGHIFIMTVWIMYVLCIAGTTVGLAVVQNTYTTFYSVISIKVSNILVYLVTMYISVYQPPHISSTSYKYRYLTMYKYTHTVKTRSCIYQ